LSIGGLNGTTLSLYLGLSRTPLKIDGQITFGLALQTCIAQRDRPFAFCAVILQTTVLHWLMAAFAYIMEYYAQAFIAGHSKAHAISMAGVRHPRTAESIAQVTEIVQLGFRGRSFFRTRVAGSGKTRT